MRLVFFLLICLSFSCRKSPTATDIDEPAPTGMSTVLAKADFVSNVHATSGNVSYARNSSGERVLRFQNFKTDRGPDLRVWLAKSEKPGDYQELGILKAVSGNFSYELAASADPTQFPYVLIWCEDFSVLFGHAVLK